MLLLINLAFIYGIKYMLIQIKSLIYDSSRIGRRFALIYTDNIFFYPGYAVQGSAFWVEKPKISLVKGILSSS